MKRVLIPFDFSQSASNSLLYASELFKENSTIYYVLSNNEEISASFVDDDYNDGLSNPLVDESNEELDKILNDFQNESKNSNHHYKAISGYESNTTFIKHFVKNENIDMVIMGAVGAKSGLEVFIGNNTIKVINTIDSCPIIIVPSEYKFKVPSQVVLSTNFKRKFSYNELLPLIELIKVLNMKLKIVQIMMEEYLNEAQKVNKEKLKEIFSDIDYFFVKIDVIGSESQAIKDFVVKTESDMVSFIHHKQSFFHKFTEENVIKKVSFMSPVPMLVLSEIN